MKRVIIESPFGTKPDGTRCTPTEMQSNVQYAQMCMLDSLRRGEAPYASHLLYPQVLHDALPEERKLGMSAGFAWADAADLIAVYSDRGLSPGMKEGIARHAAHIPVEYRYLDGIDRSEEEITKVDHPSKRPPVPGTGV